METSIYTEDEEGIIQHKIATVTTNNGQYHLHITSNTQGQEETLDKQSFPSRKQLESYLEQQTIFRISDFVRKI